VNFSEFFELSI